jgi:hypothetical protein
VKKISRMHVKDLGSRGERGEIMKEMDDITGEIIE